MMRQRSRWGTHPSWQTQDGSSFPGPWTDPYPPGEHNQNPPPYRFSEMDQFHEAYQSDRFGRNEVSPSSRENSYNAFYANNYQHNDPRTRNHNREYSHEKTNQSSAKGEFVTRNRAQNESSRNISEKAKNWNSAECGDRNFPNKFGESSQVHYQDSRSSRVHTQDHGLNLKSNHNKYHQRRKLTNNRTPFESSESRPNRPQMPSSHDSNSRKDGPSHIGTFENSHHRIDGRIGQSLTFQKRRPLYSGTASSNANGKNSDACDTLRSSFNGKKGLQSYPGRGRIFGSLVGRNPHGPNSRLTTHSAECSEDESDEISYWLKISKSKEPVNRKSRGPVSNDPLPGSEEARTNALKEHIDRLKQALKQKKNVNFNELLSSGDESKGENHPTVKQKTLPKNLAELELDASDMRAIGRANTEKANCGVQEDSDDDIVEVSRPPTPVRPVIDLDTSPRKNNLTNPTRRDSSSEDEDSSSNEIFMPHKRHINVEKVVAKIGSTQDCHPHHANLNSESKGSKSVDPEFISSDVNFQNSEGHDDSILSAEISSRIDLLNKRNHESDHQKTADRKSDNDRPSCRAELTGQYIKETNHPRTAHSQNVDNKRKPGNRRFSAHNEFERNEKPIGSRSSVDSQLLMSTSESPRASSENSTSPRETGLPTNMNPPPSSSLNHPRRRTSSACEFPSKHIGNRGAQQLPSNICEPRSPPFISRRTHDSRQKKIIKDLQKMSQSKLRDLVNNPRSGKLNFAMEELMKEHRHALSKKSRDVAEKRIPVECLNPKSTDLPPDDSKLLADFAIDWSSLPGELISTLGDLFQDINSENDAAIIDAHMPDSEGSCENESVVPIISSLGNDGIWHPGKNLCSIEQNSMQNYSEHTQQIRADDEKSPINIISSPERRTTQPVRIRVCQFARENPVLSKDCSGPDPQISKGESRRTSPSIPSVMSADMQCTNKQTMDDVSKETSITSFGSSGGQSQAVHLRRQPEVVSSADAQDVVSLGGVPNSANNVGTSTSYELLNSGEHRSGQFGMRTDPPLHLANGEVDSISHDAKVERIAAVANSASAAEGVLVLSHIETKARGIIANKLPGNSDVNFKSSETSNVKVTGRKKRNKNLEKSNHTFHKKRLVHLEERTWFGDSTSEKSTHDRIEPATSVTTTFRPEEEIQSEEIASVVSKDKSTVPAEKENVSMLPVLMMTVPTDGLGDIVCNMTSAEMQKRVSEIDVHLQSLVQERYLLCQAMKSLEDNNEGVTIQPGESTEEFSVESRSLPSSNDADTGLSTKQSITTSNSEPLQNLQCIVQPIPGSRDIGFEPCIDHDLGQQNGKSSKRKHPDTNHERPLKGRKTDMLTMSKNVESTISFPETPEDRPVKNCFVRLERFDSNNVQTACPNPSKESDVAVLDNDIQYIKNDDCSDKSESKSSGVEKLSDGVVNFTPVQKIKGTILDVKIVERTLYAGSQNGLVYVLNTHLALLATLGTPSLSGVTCLEVVHLSPSKRFLFTGSGNGFLGVFHLPMKNQQFQEVLPKETHCVSNAIHCMEAKWGSLYIGTKAGSVVLYNIEEKSFAEPWILGGYPVLSLRCWTEGPRKVLIVACRQQPISIRDAVSGLLLRSFGGCDWTVYTMVVHRNLLYCGSTLDNVVAFDFHTGDLKYNLRAGVGIVDMRIAGNLLYCACYNGNIYVYNVENNELFGTYGGPGKMLLSIAYFKKKLICSSKDCALAFSQIPKALSRFYKQKKKSKFMS